MPQKHGPGCHCCGESCDPTLTETFDSDLSAWTEEAGEWSIDAGAAEADSADALLQSVATFTDTEWTLYAVVNLDTVGDEARLSVGTDEDDYLFAEVQVTDDLAFLRLGQVVGGSETYFSPAAAQIQTILSTGESGEWGADDDFVIKLCYSNGELRANIYQGTTVPSTTFHQFAAHTVAMPSPFKVGIGTGVQTGSVRFLGVTYFPCGTCGTRCDAVNEIFDRDDIGENLEVRSGTWNCDTTDWLHTSSSDSLIVSESSLDDGPLATHPNAQVGEFAATIPRGGIAVGAIAYTNDTNYLFSTVALSSDGETETLRIYFAGMFGDTLLATATVDHSSDPPANIGRIWRLCYSGATLTMTVLAGPNLTATVGAHTGRRAGVGTRSSSGTVKFFQLKHTRLGTNVAWNLVGGMTVSSGDCPACVPACDAFADQDPAPPLEYTATVPGGWTNGEDCDGCTAIDGEFVLRNVDGGCCWVYQGETVCSFSIPSCTPSPATFGIRMELCVTLDGDDLLWQLRINLQPTEELSCIDPLSPRYAVYEATTSNGDNASQNPPATLTLVSDDLTTLASGYQICGGTAPATISLAI